MDEKSERECIKEKAFQLCKHLALVQKPPMPEKLFEDNSDEEFTREGKSYIDRSIAQLCQVFVFSEFIATITDSYLQLLSEPEQAGEIAAEGLRKLHRFLEEYTDLLIKEYDSCE